MSNLDILAVHKLLAVRSLCLHRLTTDKDQDSDLTLLLLLMAYLIAS